MFFEHFARYKFARKYIKNKKILDAACGTGYGSYYLAKQAGEVHGIDISEEAINFCKQNYHNRKLYFHVMDVTNTSFSENTFDTIVSFETIEHLEHATNFLDEMKRILKTRGIFIVSTPVKGVYNKTFLGDNPFHLHEMSIQEFQSELSSRFKITGMFGQVFKPHMMASETKLDAQNRYKKTAAFKFKDFLRNYVFNHAVTYPLFLTMSSKIKDALLIPYQKDSDYKYITVVCVNND